MIAAKPEQQVTDELKNKGDVDHNFAIDSLGISQDLAPGQTVQVQVTLPQTGDVTFYCEYHEGPGCSAGSPPRDRGTRLASSPDAKEIVHVPI